MFHTYLQSCQEIEKINYLLEISKILFHFTLNCINLQNYNLINNYNNEYCNNNYVFLLLYFPINS